MGNNKIPKHTAENFNPNGDHKLLNHGGGGALSTSPLATGFIRVRSDHFAVQSRRWPRPEWARRWYRIDLAPGIFGTVRSDSTAAMFWREFDAPPSAKQSSHSAIKGAAAVERRAESDRCSTIFNTLLYEIVPLDGDKNQYHHHRRHGSPSPLVGTGARTGDDADRFVSSSFRHRQLADFIQILNFFW